MWNLQLERIQWERWWAGGPGHRGYLTPLTGVKADADEEMNQACDVADGFEEICFKIFATIYILLFGHFKYLTESDILINSWK